MDSYSILLVASITSVGVALTLGLGARLRKPKTGGLGKAGDLSLIAAVLGFSLCLASAGVHVVFGHPPGSPTGLGLWSFLAEHPAIPVLAALAVLSIALSHSAPK